MRIITVSVVLMAATLSSSSVVKTPTGTDGNFELLILHNNDMHARFEQTSQLSGACTTADREAGKCYGGFPRVATIVKEARKAAASGEGPPVLYLNAGDTYTGTAWFTIYKWKIAAEFVNALQPDAVSFGNNDLTAGSSELSPFLDSLETNILSTNIYLHTDKANEKVKKSIIFNINGVKVGLLGYLTIDKNLLDTTGSIEYTDEVLALRDEVLKLQAENVKIIIALGHSDVEKSLEIAAKVEGIDVVISGHKNQFLWNGTTVDNISMAPMTVTQESGKRVQVIQSFAYDKYLGKAHIKFDENGEISWNNFNPILLDSIIPQDNTCIKIAEKYNRDATISSSEVIGATAVTLDGGSCNIEECNFGNLVTDAMMYRYATHFIGEHWTDAPIAIIPGGAIPGTISPSSTITNGDLLSALPEENSIVVVNMNGTIVKQMLEHSVQQYSSSNANGGFLQFSGIRVVYDLTKEPGSRLVTALMRCWDCFVPDFFELNDRNNYKILMPSTLAAGKYGYSMLTGLSKNNVNYDVLTSTKEYIKLRSPVYPEVAERITIRSDSAIATTSNITLLTLVLMTYFYNN